MKLNIFIFLLVVNFAFGQKGNVINKESTSFQIKDKNENIDFIIFDTKLDSKKPVFLWCQGSLPYPLYVDSKEGIWLIESDNETYYKVTYFTHE